MVFLLTLKPKKECNKSKLILRYDTDREEGNLIGSKKLTTSLNKQFKSTSGLVYSGDTLCIGIQSLINENDYIAFFDCYSENCKIFKCNFSKNIGNIISLFPGKLYLDSYDINSIVSISFDHVNFLFFDDSLYYNIKDSKIKSLCNYKNNWFLAIQNKNKIIDLSNNRTVFSDIEDPCSLFFNDNHRLCFIEKGRDLFHCGDKIFKVNKNPTTAIKDHYINGYWIVCGTDLLLIDYYTGNIIVKKDLSNWGIEFNNIVEAKGRFYETNFKNHEN